MTDPQQPQPGGDELDGILGILNAKIVLQVTGNIALADSGVDFTVNRVLDNARAAEHNRYIEEAKAAINAYILAEVLAIIGDDEPEPTHYGKRIPVARSVVAFQKYYRNKLRAELRQAAIARFGKGETVTNEKGEVG